MQLSTRLVLGFAIAAVPTSAMAAAFFPFDTESELTYNFAANRNGLANNNFTFDPAGGIGGTGGVKFSGITAPDVPANGYDATNVLNTPISMQDGQQYVISTMFKSTPSASWGTSWRFVQLGLVNRADRSFNGDLGDTGFIAPRLNSNFNVQFQTKNVSGGAANINGPSNAAPEYQLFGNWLKVTVSIQQTNTAAGTFAYSMSIQDFGVDGLTPGILFNVPAPGTITLGGLANQPLYPAFRSAGPFAGDPPALPAPVFYDNFSAAVIPEPAALGFLPLAGALLARRRR